ncbi:MAG: hypothetical protein ACLQDL_09705 [Spirochaetia bacterium]
MSRRRGRAAAACAVALLLFAGCSGKPPVLSRVFGRVIYVHDPATNTNTETLGVFLVASDPDGMENLSAFYVINDEAELFWKVDSASWVTSTAEGETWIGTTSLSMPGTTPVPSGEYRVILQASGGATVEDTLSVPPRSVSAAEATYPAAVVENGIINVSGTAAGYEIWVYGKDGAFAGSFPSTGASNPVSVQQIQASGPALAGGFTFRVFVWNAAAGYGVLSGPYSTGS